MRYRSLPALVVALAMLAGCESSIAPEGAVPFTPPVEYRLWWDEAADCAEIERTGFAEVDWYVLPGVWTFADPVREGEQDYGLWVGGADPRIYLAEEVSRMEQHVKHEMMHALLRTGGHPVTFFGPRCGL